MLSDTARLNCQPSPKPSTDLRLAYTQSIPLSLSPAVLIPSVPTQEYNDDDAFGGELKVFSSACIARLADWRESVRELQELQGQLGFVYSVPTFLERFLTFLRALFGPRWEQSFFVVRWNHVYWKFKGFTD